MNPLQGLKLDGLQLVRPHSYSIVGRHKLLGVVGHEIAQYALGSLLNESELDDILS